MAAAGRVRSEDQFLCSICLDVFTDPVSTPCGHNFCKSCIFEHWDNNKIYQCPMCQKAFDPRPELYVNTFISEIVAQFRLELQHEPKIYSSDQKTAKPGEVPCDVCAEPKLKALKSCLVCLTSYCQTHLEPHLTSSGLKRHQLIQPVENLEDRMCRKHDKPLELFCKTDHTCICLLCPVLDHKNHEFVHLKDEYEEQKAELKKTEAEIQQIIQERRLKIQEIQRSVEVSKNTADRKTAEGVEVFTALMESVQRSLDQFLEKIQEKQKSTEKQAEDFIKELEQEICELEKRSTEVKQLLGSEDHLHFVQRFTCVKAAPSMKTWTKVSVHPPSYEGTVVRAVSELEDKLTEDMKKVVKAELKRVRQYEVDLTLDPDTAHPDLILSDDGKQVHDSDKKNNLPDKPQRFSKCVSILAKQSFSSGRFYFEVQVKGKTEWSLGVVRESINRKGDIICSPQDGYWIITLRNGNEYKALADPSVRLSVKSGPQKVGVFVDYEEGLVSFYDVGSSVLIYSFTGCCFNDKLLPYFSPGLNDGGENSVPLIITPVDTE
ncbi:E3 ubiquitin-protein ligase TRIM39-like [Sphaeramia orbicularis]|uniref:E3 ubiquitin-protein ligase TRIM39-like n=1 Tax=Sphaeramia orbicularis TaxID=375764 RepID=A0A672YXT8_9TELE|nr:E3 ubiquitin-protein ligase TRIM39-like [Sphaeramia orbicularis]XP_029998417.1 E3 ubiquitin-protein ligase TRIM39-like [Sphaeramia orbicularis]